MMTVLTTTMMMMMMVMMMVMMGGDANGLTANLLYSPMYSEVSRKGFRLMAMGWTRMPQNHIH